MINIILFLVAWILIPPLTVWNLIIVNQKYGNTKGYFRSTALSIDIWGNREFRTYWNTKLIPNENLGYSFGKVGETISSAIGKNIVIGKEVKRSNVIVGLIFKKYKWYFKINFKYKEYKRYNSLTKFGNRLNFILDVSFNETDHSINAINKDI